MIEEWVKAWLEKKNKIYTVPAEYFNKLFDI